MACITNRSPWGVFTQSSKKTLGEFSSQKKAQQFADQWAISGPVAAVEVRQMESGPWHVRIRRQGFPLVTDTFTAKRDAKDFVAIKESEMIRREFQDYRVSDKIILKDLLLRYRDNVTKKDPLGDNSEWHRLTKLARHGVAAHSITKLKPSHLAAYRDERLNGEKPVKPATVKSELDLISKVIKVARREWDLALPKNVATGEWVKRPKLGRESERVRRLETVDGFEEEKRLFAALKASRNPMLAPMVCVALETGIRRGELLRVHWSHINLEVGYITLSADITKSGYARQVPLSAMALDALKSIPRAENTRVFEGQTRDSIKCAFRRLCERAGIKDLGIHDLRHEFISRLHEDTDLRSDEMRQITGHKDDRMLERYTHLRPSHVVQRFHESKARIAQSRAEKLAQECDASARTADKDEGIAASVEGVRAITASQAKFTIQNVMRDDHGWARMMGQYPASPKMVHYSVQSAVMPKQNTAKGAS